jgi:hypothetical protein
MSANDHDREGWADVMISSAGKKKRNIEDLKLRDWLPYHAHAAAGGRPDSS